MKNTTKVLLFLSAFFNLMCVNCIALLNFNYFYAMVPGFNEVWMWTAGISGTIGFCLTYCAIATK